MKTGNRIWMVFMVLLFISQPAQSAAVRVTPSVHKEEGMAVDKERLQKAQAKLERPGEKYEKRLNRLEQKMKKRRLAGEEQSQDVWDDNKFRLGMLLLLVAIGLAIISVIISLAGLFSFMAGLFALAGVILVIWSLVENYG
ncbi:MAG: DUF4337 family protein [Phaeodactylibacter sp.]|nr:DUF4337 family protein [Phaeodactylibacter sp.]